MYASSMYVCFRHVISLYLCIAQGKLFMNIFVNVLLKSEGLLLLGRFQNSLKKAQHNFKAHRMRA